MVWNVILEDEEVQALTISKMNDLTDVIKETRLFLKSDEALEKFGEKNYKVMYHELKSIETQYLQKWVKFNEDKSHTEMFLGMSAYLSILYLKYDELDMQMTVGVRPLMEKQTTLLQKRIMLEKKYENSSEIVKEQKKINDLKNDLYNKRIREEINLILPESISSSRSELKIGRKEFLNSWKKYNNNTRLENEFIKSSNEYARLLSKVKTLEESICKWRKTKPYRQMLRECYLRYSILEDKLLKTGETHD